MPLNMETGYVTSFFFTQFYTRFIGVHVAMYSLLYSIEFWLLKFSMTVTAFYKTVKTKYDAIEKLESGASAAELMKIHGVGKATIVDIKKIKT